MGYVDTPPNSLSLLFELSPLTIILHAKLGKLFANQLNFAAFPL